MRICDLPDSEIKIGLQIRSLVNPSKIGTIVAVDPLPYDPYWHVQWEGEDVPTSGFFWNFCRCEVVT